MSTQQKSGHVPELLVKKRKRDEQWAAERAAAALEARKQSKIKRKDMFKRAEQYVKEYREQVSGAMGEIAALSSPLPSSCNSSLPPFQPRVLKKLLGQHGVCSAPGGPWQCPQQPSPPLLSRMQDKSLVQLKRAAKAKGGFHIEAESKLMFVIRIRGLNKIHPQVGLPLAFAFVPWYWATLCTFSNLPPLFFRSFAGEEDPAAPAPAADQQRHVLEGGCKVAAGRKPRRAAAVPDVRVAASDI